MSARSVPHAEPKQKRRLDDAPPIADPADLGVVAAALGVGLRDADAAASVLGDHPGAGLAREVWPAIVGSVVNDDRLRDDRRDAADERGDRVTLVEQRKDHRDGAYLGHDGTLRDNDTVQVVAD